MFKIYFILNLLKIYLHIMGKYQPSLDEPPFDCHMSPTHHTS